MKLIMISFFISSLVTIQTDAKPVEAVDKDDTKCDPGDIFCKMVVGYVANKKIEDLCSLRNNLYNILNQSKDDHDRKTIKTSLESLNNATKKLENFHCQGPVITMLVTTTTTTENPTTTIENEPITLKIEVEEEPKSLCDDCGMDYEGKDEAREEFSQVLEEAKEEELSVYYKPKTIALFSLVGIFGILLIAAVSFACFKIVTCLV